MLCFALALLFSSAALSPPALASPLTMALANSDTVAVGRHTLSLPKDLTGEAATAAHAFIEAIRANDAAIVRIPDTATLTVPEAWTDASGQTHRKTYTASGADYKSHWNKASFALFHDSVYSSTLNGPETNASGRGSSDMGLDPQKAGNHVSGFNLEKIIVPYYAGNKTAALEYLALHEVGHNTAAGVQANNDTGIKVDTFLAGTPNYANENFANTLALSVMQTVGLNVGWYSPKTILNGWQNEIHWTMPAGSGSV